MSTQDIVQRLWNLCHVLRDDGVTYHEYVTELTYLLFLKMAQETGAEKAIPKGLRWTDLTAKDGVEQFNFYKKMLVDLGTESRGRVQTIFANAQTALRQPKNLKKLTNDIDALDWFSAKQEGLGDLYEGLLEKNASEVKSGAGQYFTPRPLIECIVSLVKPKAGEKVQDPALGTGGFLICADRYVKSQTSDLFDLPEQLQTFQAKQAFYGMELVPDTHRLALMNALLHDIEGDWVLGDTLSPAGADLPQADVILTNPPFGTKKGGEQPTRDDFTFPTSNKQLAFVQHVYRGLKAGGRAAVVVPDNVLFEDGQGVKIRQDMMEKCDLHTILRLPTGIFYAQGVKTNVAFFTRGKTDKGNTQRVWIYDMRTNMPSFGKRTPLTHDHFKEFEAAFGADPHGKSMRKCQGEEGRFRCFDREFLENRDWNLDITWLRDESNNDQAHSAPDPEAVTLEVAAHLRASLDEVEALLQELPDPSTLEATDAVRTWCKIPLHELVEIKYGKLLSSRDLSKSGYPVFGANGIIGYHSEYNCVEPVVLVGCRGSCGGIYLTTGESYVTNNSLLLAPWDRTAVCLPFLRYSLLHADLSKVITGTAQPQITIAAISQMDVAVAPMNEQLALVRVIDGLFARIDSARTALERAARFLGMSAAQESAVNRLGRLEQAILAKAFRGELVPQDPRDESASALLQRIRSTRGEPEARRGKRQRRGRPARSSPADQAGEADEADEPAETA